MKFIVLAAIALALSGCTTRTIVFPDGTTYTSRSFLTNPNVGQVTLKNSPHTGMEFGLASYGHNQTDIPGLILEIAARRVAP